MGPTEAAADHFCSLGFRAAFESSRENVADLLLDAISGAIRPSEHTAAHQQTPHGAARSLDLAEAWRAARTDTAAGAAAAAAELGAVQSPRRWATRAAAEMSTLDRRLRHHHGRRTASGCRQLALFVWRSAVQHARDGGTLLRNAAIVGVAGTLLGFLYEGTLEKAVCAHVEDIPFPNGPRAWEEGCRARLASGGAFTAAPVFCFGEGTPAARIDLAQFRDVTSKLVQALTLTLLAVTIVSIQVSLNLLGGERAIYWRESRHYSVWAYLLGKTAATLPLTLAYPFLFLLPFYQLFRPWATWQVYYGILVLVQFAGEGIGQLISLLATDSRQLAGGVMALLLTCLSGSFPLITAPPIKAVSFASLSRWGVEALYANEMSPFYYGEPSLRGRGCCTYEYAASPQLPIPHPLAWNASTPCRNPLPPGSAEKVASLLGGQYGYTAWWRHNDCGEGSVRGPGDPPPDIVGCGTWDGEQPLLVLLTIAIVARLLVLVALLVKDRRRRK
mmetsp:Transcript_31086/g.103906  ORF Transcript_31086/g.103906 Transcript_31086/m.103906 type:complete len:502 (+) Transcript_31086:1630-3135(+)